MWAGHTIQSPIVLVNDGDEDKDNTARLSDLIALAEVGLQAEEDVFFSHAAEAAYYRRQADQGNAGEPSHSNEVVIEDWYSDDELPTQYVLD